MNNIVPWINGNYNPKAYEMEWNQSHIHTRKEGWNVTGIVLSVAGFIFITMIIDMAFEIQFYSQFL